MQNKHILGYDWSSVDWQLPVSVIAKRLKCALPTVYAARKKYRTKTSDDLVATHNNAQNGRAIEPLTFTVEQNIPLVPRGTAANVRYPFATMAVGDSFFFELPLKGNSVVYAAKQAQPKWEWAVRSVKNGRGTVIGGRIWRTK